MFRHYRVILRQPAINTLSSYISIPNAAVGNTVYNQNVSLPKHVTQFDKGTDSVRTEPERQYHQHTDCIYDTD